MNEMLGAERDYRVKLSFYVPIDSVEAVKTAVFNAGAGRMGHYQHCAWQTLGEGQFMPLVGAQPNRGVAGELTHVPEYKVEVLCQARLAAQIEAALVLAHPYEVPAYEFTRLWQPSDL
jgi:structural toxin protein (hemagglutinin/hemolysin) RtxA